MRSRAAILPYPGDPFLLHYWLELFYKIWADEIDKLYIVFNSPIEKSVVEYITYLCTEDSEKIDFTYIDHHIQHGDAIRIALEKCTEKYVMLIEDDAFIFKSGVVDDCFKRIEGGEYDIVGSKRGSCSFEILKKAQELWGIPYEGEGDQGCNFWPCYFFSSAELLLSTDRDFNARAWVQGDKIVPLDCVVEVPIIASDTFVSTSLQLQSKIPQNRILYLPQYHASPDDVKNHEYHRYLFDGKAPWTHIGSLSSGISGALMDDHGRPLSRRLLDAPKEETVLPSAWCDVTSESAKMEWERRVQFWLTFWENRDPKEIQEFAEIYRIALDQLIHQFRLNIGRIKERQVIYKQALGL